MLQGRDYTATHVDIMLILYTHDLEIINERNEERYVLLYDKKGASFRFINLFLKGALICQLPGHFRRSTHKC